MGQWRCINWDKEQWLQYRCLRGHWGSEPSEYITSCFIGGVVIALLDLSDTCFQYDCMVITYTEYLLRLSKDDLLRRKYIRESEANSFSVTIYKDLLLLLLLT